MTAAGSLAGTKQPLTISVSPTSVTAGSTGNVFTLKVTATSAVTGQLSLVVPAGWTAPQASNSTMPGYVVIQKLTCASAGPFPASISGSGPWTMLINFDCAANKNFSITYGGTVPPSKVTAPLSAGFYELTSSADLGSGLQRLATQPVVEVTPPSVHLVVGDLPGTAVAGAANAFTVTARDSSNKVVTKYTGTVNLGSTDGAAGLPANYTFTSADSGSHTFSPGATFYTFGSQTLTATDTSNAAITGSQATTVAAGPTTKFVVSGLASPSSAGASQALTVTAKDAFNNTTTGYTGTVHFTSSDAASTLPANYTFTAADAGVHTFNGVTLGTAGSQSVTATDTATASITGSQTVTVNAGAAAQLVLGALTDPVAAGAPQDVTVTLKDGFGNTATGYTGTVHFASSDGSATLPGDYSFVAADNGSHTFSGGVTLTTAGQQSVTATDTANNSLTDSKSTSVTAGPLASLQLTSTNPTIAAPPPPLPGPFMDVAEQNPPPPLTNLTAEGVDAYGNDIGDRTAAAQWAMVGGSCFPVSTFEACGNATVAANGLTITATVGNVSGLTLVNAANGTVTHSCQGEHYDVDNNTIDGCEQFQPLAAHNQNTAFPLGDLPCFDSPPTLVNGVLRSDSRVHANPAVNGFNPNVGSAPEWYSVHATGGFFCINDFSVTITVTGSTAPSCYYLTMTTDQGTFSAQTTAGGTATITGGSGSYSDDTTVFFKVEKTCSLPVQESINYSISFHL